MVKEGICVFSGRDVNKGSGLIKVMNDTKVFLFSSRKVRTLSDRKVNPRSVGWTQSSRLFHKKGSKKTVQKETILKVVKEVRGFPMIPKSMIKAAPLKEKKEANAEMFRKSEKVSKKANLQSSIRNTSASKNVSRHG